MFHGYDLRRTINQGSRIYDKLLAYGDCFLAISDYSSKHLLKLGADLKKIAYLPVGISLDEFPFRWDIPPSETPVPCRILTTARLTEEKGLFCGIQAVDKLIKRNPHLHVEYQIIGGGPLEEELKRFVNDLKIDKVVHFLGPQKREGVIETLGQAHLFLFPSNVEVLPLALMEAQASGLPVVATSVGGISELVNNGQSGYLVPHGDMEAMAERLEYLTRHPESWAEMGLVARKHVEENYSIEKLNNRLVQTYQCLINQSPIPK